MLKSVKCLTSYVNLVFLVTLLAACGGGDSRSGSGSVSQLAIISFIASILYALSNNTQEEARYVFL